MSASMFQSLIDRKIGLTPLGNLAGNDIEITRPAVDAVITVGAESANVRAITVQLRDITGVNIAYVEGIQIIMFTTAAMVAYGTGGSTGIEVGASGGLLAVVAKKAFLAQTTAAGLLALTWTDTGTESVALGVRLPNGRTVVSAAFANT